MKTTDFNIGDTVTIIRSPSCWSSRLCRNSPMGENIFPYTAKIIDKECVDHNHVAVKIGEYGFDLHSLVKSGIIRHISSSELTFNFDN